jgi:phenylacetic acid degradation operon negative regulatory protein
LLNLEDPRSGCVIGAKRRHCTVSWHCTGVAALAYCDRVRAGDQSNDQALLEIAGASGRQHLLLTLLGDYWYPRFDPLPSGALVDLLAEFGVSETNTRAALSRMSRKDLLVAGRQGRRTVYALSDAAMQTLHDGTRRIFTFGAQVAVWDGRWTLVAFSVPEENRSVRSTLRIKLGWKGFASLFDGVWVAPGARDAEAAGLLGELGVEMATVLVGKASDLGRNGSPARAWNLDGLRDQYNAFIETFQPVADRLAGDHLGSHEALVARTAVIDAWRAFPAVDPELPDELLPAEWPLMRARQLFATVYDALGPAASDRFRALLAIHDPAAADLTAHHTSTTALNLCHSR